MKLFGNHRKKKKDPDAKPSFWSSVSKGKKAILIVLAVLTVLVGALVALEVFYIRAPHIEKFSISAESADDGSNGIPAQQTGAPGEYKQGFYNILLVGTDKSSMLTDTIMIARLDTVNHTTAIMSIPRDTTVQTSHGTVKLNSVYGSRGGGIKGIEALMLEVEKIVGFMPTGYVLVDLNAFVELVDTIGGVYFDVPQRMIYNDPTQNLYIDLYPGYQLLDGEHAMQLVRFRQYAQADIQRTKVQQDFLRETAKQCLDKLSHIQEYCRIFDQNVTTNFTAGNLLYFAQELAKCDFDNMKTYTLPGDPVWIYGGSYYRLNQDQVQEIVKADFDPKNPDLPKERSNQP